VHKLVLFVNFLSIGFTRESSQSFLMHIHSQRLVRSDTNIDSEVKLVPVYQKWICYVFANYRCFFNVNVIDVIDKINTFTLATVRWFDDPDVFLAFMLL
jgi:hypothetical protein